ncbi:cobyric acid synthase [Pedobacter sp. MC2016-15]|uniref:cobyric acid synthase n=1 Tax=Pedobacter sp. MC2016-15 TaxID=2994473 RepID=UPI0022456192|nr:cobyric acid synthase [Pedobacter sp. MC2016-15]MCX2477874.1 cobyric acid synthase [Pedobacter sp. MC2016-15]
MEMQYKLRPVMFVGTSSDVGKSVITAGFCRIFKQDGYAPAPFKAQNMSLNSYATPEGLEIGRAQAVQAEAAGIPCHTDMNPVLLKPTTDKTSQVILNGKFIGNQTAKEYFMSGDRAALFEEVKLAYGRLASRYHPIVMEGAGSISELNLKARDITNMRMAIAAGAATYLITDIDRGGIFASLYGTMQLLQPEEKACIKGIIINKFRGDAALFQEGKKIIEELCGVPVVGILPYFRDIHIEEEDAVALQQKRRNAVSGKVNIAVVLLGRMSNFTDFDRLDKDPRVNLYYTHTEDGLSGADIIILPGSKNTIEDLIELKNNGLAAAILDAHQSGKTVIGICGGYQMMGEMIADPLKVESSKGEIAGLGILPVTTTLLAEKTTRVCEFTYRGYPELCRGYEIHMGETRMSNNNEVSSAATAIFADGHADGYFVSEKCWGSYLHGILDNPVVINDIVAPYTDEKVDTKDYSSFREEQYDKLADLLRANLDIDLVYQHLKL